MYTDNNAAIPGLAQCSPSCNPRQRQGGGPWGAHHQPPQQPKTPSKTRGAQPGPGGGELIKIFRPGSSSPSAAASSVLRRDNVPASGGCLRAAPGRASRRSSPRLIPCEAAPVPQPPPPPAARRTFPLRVRCRPAPPARRSPACSPAAAAPVLRRSGRRRFHRGRGQVLLAG